MAVVPTSFSSQYEYNYGKEPFSYTQPYGATSSLYSEPQSAINWQSYPSQIAPVNSAMNSLFPPFSRGSTQKVMTANLAENSVFSHDFQKKIVFYNKF